MAHWYINVLEFSCLMDILLLYSTTKNITLTGHFIFLLMINLFITYIIKITKKPCSDIYESGFKKKLAQLGKASKKKLRKV